MKKQPYLTDFPLHIFGLIQRKKQAAIRVAREKITRDSLSGYAVLFEHILGSDFLSKIDQTKRQRSYGNIPIFWAWLAQILDQNCKVGINPQDYQCQLVELAHTAKGGHASIQPS